MGENKMKTRKLIILLILVMAFYVSKVFADCSAEQANMENALKQIQTKMVDSSGYQGMCALAKEARKISSALQRFYSRCPSADPTGEMTTYANELKNSANQTSPQACPSSY